MIWFRMSFEDWLANFERLTMCHLYPDAVTREICETNVSWNRPLHDGLLLVVVCLYWLISSIVHLLFVFGFLRVWCIALKFIVQFCLFFDVFRLFQLALYPAQLNLWFLESSDLDQSSPMDWFWSLFRMNRRPLIVAFLPTFSWTLLYVPTNERRLLLGLIFFIPAFCMSKDLP